MWPRRRAGRPRALVSVSPDQKRPCLGITIGLTPYRGPESAPTLLAATTIPGAGGITAIGPSSSGTAQPVPSKAAPAAVAGAAVDQLAGTDRRPTTDALPKSAVSAVPPTPAGATAEHQHTAGRWLDHRGTAWCRGDGHSRDAGVGLGDAQQRGLRCATLRRQTHRHAQAGGIGGGLDAVART